MNRPNSPFRNLLIYEKIFFPDSTLSTVPENLIKQGFTPKNDIYFAFSGGEEVNGNGAVKKMFVFFAKVM